MAKGKISTHRKKSEIRDNAVAVFLEVENYDLGRGILSVRSRAESSIKFKIPLADAIAFPLSTSRGQAAVLASGMPAEIIMATKEWALVRPIDARIPIVVETSQLGFSMPAEVA